MANIIIASFKEETKALEALNKMKELDTYGDITLYDYLMIRKKGNDLYEIWNDEIAGVGWSTLTNISLGSLLETLVGPTGLVFGLYSGSEAGSIKDRVRYDFEDGFTAKISSKMKTDETTIVAEIGEDSPLILDNYVRSRSTKMLQTDADVEHKDYVEEQIEEWEDDIEELREKLKRVPVAKKEKIRAKIAIVKSKRKYKLASLKAEEKSTLAQMKKKAKAKIDKMEEKLEKFAENMSDSLHKSRAKSLQKRIAKQQSKLDKLNKELEDVLD